MTTTPRRSDDDRLIFAPPQPGSGDTPDPGVVTLHDVDSAREVLRASTCTRQAGFTSERIPDWMFTHRPILFDDGEAHDEHRKRLARFFAPQVLAAKYQNFIVDAARESVEEARRQGAFDVDKLALHFSVRVASHIVGLTHGSTEARSQRLTRFFQQPPVVHTKPDHGRTTKQWIEAAQKALGPLIAFYLRDVRPVIKARKKQRQDDIISYLLDEGYNSREILMECMTYGTAGMVTTREFICAALWHLLRDDRLRSRYLSCDEAERTAILHEIIRIEPPVGHLYRRIAQDRTGKSADAPEGSACPYSEGTLVDIDVREANLDPAIFGEDAGRIRPDRKLRAADRSGLSFGDGGHRCPGAPLAILETDALILELLRANPTMIREPEVEWDTLVEGYQLRGLRLTLG